MFQINGWLGLFTEDSYIAGEDPWLASRRDDEKVDHWKERVNSVAISGLKMSVRSMNGDWVLTVHSVSAVAQTVVNEFTSLLSELLSTLSESEGLLFIEDISTVQARKYTVMVVKNGKISYQHDPFLTHLSV